MKRLFSLLMVLTLAAALCLPVWADDSNPDSGINNGGDTSTVTTDNQGVYVTGYTVTTPAGGEITTLNVGDQVNIVLQVVDHSSARYAVKAEDIVARINSSIFTYTGTGEIGQLFESNDDPDQTRKDPQYNYYSYVLLFRDVIYNGGGNTLPINLSYLDTSKPLQQFSVTLGQCVDKDQATTPNLIVRTSNYGDAVTAGTAFTLSLGLYATDGNEALNDVIADPAGEYLAGRRQPVQLCGQHGGQVDAEYHLLGAACRRFYRHSGRHYREHDRHRRYLRQGSQLHHRYLGAYQPARPL